MKTDMHNMVGSVAQAREIQDMGEAKKRESLFHQGKSVTVPRTRIPQIVSDPNVTSS